MVGEYPINLYFDEVTSLTINILLAYTLIYLVSKVVVSVRLVLY